MKAFFLNLKKSQQISLVVLFVLTVVMAVIAAYWVLSSHYQPLNHGRLAASEVRLLAELEKQGIDYKIDDSGNLLVLDEQLGQGQLLAEKDNLTQFSSHGLELYDNADYSMTEHTQKVTFQRALQGELERTISALSYVRFARVHLSLAEKKLFSSEQKTSTSAVTLFTSKQLTASQIRAIRMLVASSVDGLDINQVAVLNSNGDVLSSENSDSLAQPNNLGQKLRVEKNLEKKAANVLNLFFDPSQYAISLNLELSLDRITEVSKELLVGSDGKGVILNQRTTATKNDSLKNTSNDVNESSDVQYTHGSRTQELIKSPGEVKRLSIAVAIHAKISNSQLAKLTALLQAALGVSKERGDLIRIEAFTPMNIDILPTEMVNQAISNPEIGTAKSTVKDQAGVDLFFNQIPVNFIVASVLLMLLFVGGLGIAINRKRLTKDEREQTLLELNQWLAGEKYGKHS